MQFQILEPIQEGYKSKISWTTPKARKSKRWIPKETTAILTAAQTTDT